MAIQNFLMLFMLFVADLEAEVWSKSLTFVQALGTRFGQDCEVEVQARFETGVWSVFFCKICV